MEESSSKEMYEDIHSLIKEITRETEISIGLGLNFKFTATEPSSSDSSGEAGSAGGGDEVADPSGGGEAPGPGEGGEAEVSGADQITSPGLGFSASAGVDTKRSTTNIIKQLSEITTTKVRFRYIACSILNICTLFIIFHIFRLMSHHLHRTGWISILYKLKYTYIYIYIYIYSIKKYFSHVGSEYK